MEDNLLRWVDAHRPTEWPFSPARIQALSPHDMTDPGQPSGCPGSVSYGIYEISYTRYDININIVVGYGVVMAGRRIFAWLIRC
jgi:hypothetical protein